MALVNFYNQTPSATQVAAELRNDEIIVFKHLTSGARMVVDEVEALIDFDIQMHQENTSPKWTGEDYEEYFVMHRIDIERDDLYDASNKEKLRVMVVDWINNNCPDQSRRI